MDLLPWYALFWWHEHIPFLTLTLGVKMDGASATTDLLPLFLTLSQDRQDSVRIHSIDNAVALARLISPETVANQVLPVIFETARDGSWRVRWSVANRFPEIGETIGAEIVNASLCDAIGALLEDNEAEVRTAATSKVRTIVKTTFQKSVGY